MTKHSPMNQQNCN